MNGNSDKLGQMAARVVSELSTSEPWSGLDESALEQLRGSLSQVLRSRLPPLERPESRKITVMMADIRGFSIIAGQIPTTDQVDLLNRFFAAMCSCVHRYGGTIDKLLGDGLMALFGVDEPEQNSARAAVACAVDMQRCMAQLNDDNREAGLPEIFMGVGINTGEALVGPLGSSEHVEYTAIGDHVNLAARIEAHSLRGQVLISEYTRQAAEGCLVLGPPNNVFVKGKMSAIAMYEVLATHWPETLEVPRREARRTVRIKVDMPCEFFLLEEKRVQPDPCQGRVLDISQEGVGIETDADLELSTEIRLPLMMSMMAKQTTPVYARIVTRERCESGFRYGASFTGMDETAREVISRFVDNALFNG